jgi:biopolymer transport protein ExbB
MSLNAFGDSKEQASSHASYTSNVEKKVITIDLKNAFKASPIIYSVLCGLSMASLTVALSAYIDINKKLKVSTITLEQTKEKLLICRYDEAIQILEKQTDASALMLKSFIDARKLGPQEMREAMKQAGKRQMMGSWQKLSLLSDIALLAPLIGLLGTVLGMFYAFYDVNRSIESLASLFDGLGVSVGTTVAGLLVALSAMILQTILKHKLISGSSKVETACESITPFVGGP